MIVALLYNLYRHHYSLGPANYVKASLIDDFKHHHNTYMYKDIEDYINWDYFKAYENEIDNKSKKSNLFELSKDVILKIEKKLLSMPNLIGHYMVQLKWLNMLI